MKILMIYLVAVNIIGIAMMGIDKRKSRRHEWRISEKSIFIVAAIGGGLGVLLGMSVFHHKTKHLKFTLGIPVLILCNIAMLGYLLQKLK